MARAPLFSRAPDERVVAGVAGGFAHRYGVTPIVVRTALVVAAFVGGLGLIAYAVGWAFSSDPVPGVPVARVPVDQRRNLAIGCVLFGGLLVLRSSGLWSSDALMIPVLAIATGVAVMGARNADGVHGGVPGSSAVGALPGPVQAVVAGRHPRMRIALGVGFVILGLVVVASRPSASPGLRVGAFSAAFALAGVAVLLGPWLARLAQQVVDERRERIRSEERAAMAAHLHDSVLQTLALIQRNAADPRRTVALARRQERELRSWLYGGPATGSGALGGGLPGVVSLQAAVQAMVEEVEGRYEMRVDAVVVGDSSSAEAVVATVGAVREAVVNAAKHARVDEVSVYVEALPDRIEAFVRDRGQGFDLAAVGADRHGIAESIRARVERIGGTATIDSALGAGTEVELRVPLREADQP